MVAYRVNKKRKASLHLHELSASGWWQSECKQRISTATANASTKSGEQLLKPTITNFQVGVEAPSLQEKVRLLTSKMISDLSTPSLTEEHIVAPLAATCKPCL